MAAPNQQAYQSALSQHAGNLTAQATPAITSLAGRVQFTLDSDIRLACEDQAQAQGIPFGEWLQQTVNDALRAQLGM